MNIEEYIASGVLESYVLGELEESGALEVEAMANAHPEIKAALRRIEDTHERLFQLNAGQISMELKDKVMGTLPFETSRQRWLFKRIEVPQLVVAASVAVFLVMAGAALLFYLKWDTTKAELVAIHENHQRMAELVDQARQELNRSNENIESLVATNTRKIELTGTSNSPGSSVSVFWNPTSAEVFIKVASLSALSAEKQFQLWGIVDGKPVGIGVFDSPETILKMNPISGSVSAFAVTIEPRGGSEAPTLETMQVIGNV